MEHEETSVRLARIETKIDTFLLNITDHETRIRSLEKSRWTYAGAAAVLTFLASKIGFPSFGT